MPQDVRFVITLDADTRLLRDTVRRMIGKMAHPLNRPRFDPAVQRVVARLRHPAAPRDRRRLPVGSDGSVYQRVFSSPGGIEPYAAAISDVYQDLFDEGSFTGKGIYDVDAFEAALAGRVPENTLLSHDLFEGIFARAALASDIEVVEDFPARLDVACPPRSTAGCAATGSFCHGSWVCAAPPGGFPPSGAGRWSTTCAGRCVAPFALAALFAGWLLPLPLAVAWTAAILALHCAAQPAAAALRHPAGPGRGHVAQPSGGTAGRCYRGAGTDRAGRHVPGR